MLGSMKPALERCQAGLPVYVQDRPALAWVHLIRQAGPRTGQVSSGLLSEQQIFAPYTPYQRGRVYRAAGPWPRTSEIGGGAALAFGRPLQDQ